MSTYAVIGCGVVGSHMANDIERAKHECLIYDVLPVFGQASREDINQRCQAAFVCVSTPPTADGACDLSAINDVLSWLDVPVVIIRSTIEPGTLDRLASEHPDMTLAFVPEFIGEGINAPYNSMRQPPFLIVGTDWQEPFEILATIYNAECEFVPVSPMTAEVCKYAENYFLALKVSWANEMFDICEKLGLNYWQMMNALTHDYRIGPSHTHVYRDRRGWGGRCLPKDTSALLHFVGADTAPLLSALIEVNKQLRSRRQ
ncbi:MAG: UDP-glucose/GDP-mannose dehydrogenase family protein [Chloroflexi bacterium]|nr:UDP-glucose/GDP-mannose dehydrogenase family protein [Chloroflexota bacterium]